MKPILVFLSVTVLTFSAKAHAQDTIYYRQAVRLENIWPSFVVKNGIITCTQDSVIFDCKKKKGKFNLSFSYNDIKKVRRYSYLWAFPIVAILPWWGILGHGVKIETKKSGRFYFLTFHRKKFVEIIKSKIAK